MNTTRQLIISILVILAADISWGQKISLAVIEFEGRGISNFEAAALTDRLRNELFRLGTYNVVERGMMEDVLEEQDFQISGCTSNECLVEVGQLLGASQIIGGSISMVGKTFTVSARIVGVEAGQVLGASDVDLEGKLDDMLTHGMKIVALRLVGDEASASKIESSYVERRERRAVRRNPTSSKLGLLVSSEDGKYTYEGQTLGRQGQLDILLALNDPEVNEYVSRYYELLDSLAWNNDRSVVSALLASICGLVGTGMIAYGTEERYTSILAFGVLSSAGGIWYAIKSFRYTFERNKNGSASKWAIRNAIIRYNRVVAAY